MLLAKSSFACSLLFFCAINAEAPSKVERALPTRTCTITPAATTHAYQHCESQGTLKHPESPPLAGPTPVDPNFEASEAAQCYRLCTQTSGCLSFAVDTNQNTCTLFSTTIRQIGVRSDTNGIFLYNPQCFKVKCSRVSYPGCQSNPPPSFLLQIVAGNTPPNYNGMYLYLHDLNDYLSTVNLQTDPGSANLFTFNSSCGVLTASGYSNRVILADGTESDSSFTFAYQKSFARSPSSRGTDLMACDTSTGSLLCNDYFYQGPFVFYGCDDGDDDSFTYMLRTGNSVPDTDPTISPGGPCYGFTLQPVFQ